MDPETIRAVGAPQRSVIHPTISEPIGVDPIRTRKYRLITRPRSCGSVASCTEEFPRVLTLTPARPVRANSGRNAGSHETRPTTISMPPKKVPNPNSIRRDPLTRRAAISAPASEPTAIVEFSQPYRPGPPPKMSPA